MQTGDSPERVTCPWCETAFDVVPNSSAMGFKCPNCGEESSLGTLRNPNLSPNAFSISKFASLATTENVYRSTAAYVFINNKGEESIASGTVVQIGDLRFLATVAHSVPKNLDAIELVKRSKLLLPGRIACVSRRVPDHDYDVAFFELEAESVAKAGLEAISIDRIYDAGVGSSNTKSRLIGYPSDYLIVDHPVPGSRALFALCYGCETIETSRWHNIVRNPDSLNSEVHVVIQFDSDVVDCSTDPIPVPAGLPGPFGMSGGELWQRRSPAQDDQIWTADAYCLFAIQSAIFTGKPFLKAVQIIHWLKLVADEHPELRPDLETHFPRLVTL